MKAVPPQPTVLVRSQFANAQDKLRSNLNSYIPRTLIWGRNPREAFSGPSFHTRYVMRRHQRKCSDLGVPAPYGRPMGSKGGRTNEGSSSATGEDV